MKELSAKKRQRLKMHFSFEKQIFEELFINSFISFDMIEEIYLSRILCKYFALFCKNNNIISK